MLNAALTHDQPADLEIAEPAAAQKVVIVNGSADILELFDAAFEAGHYNVVFVESTEHAYSKIKHVQPDLVILCMQLEDLDGFQVLSMLKLDDETREIPVVTCTTDYEGRRPEGQTNDATGAALLPAKPAVPMN